YCGGIWNLYTLNNGGAFMAPEPDDDDDETWVGSPCPGKYHPGRSGRLCPQRQRQQR
ncbi:hypothetical protein G912_04702, partial [Escherichia coli UMEA 3122-1]